MRKHKTRTLIGIVSAAFMTVGFWHMAGAATIAQRQGQSERSGYADGVYTATGQYGGGPSFVTVTVTLEDGVIADVKVRPHATVPRSLELQRAFAAAVPRVVVGRPIDQVRVGKLAGSSNTPRGFNEAIAKIRQQAAT